MGSERASNALPLSSTQRSTYGEPMPLHLDRKVFISHSGCDKEFVRFLYKDLCSGYHGIEVAFFDEKTLPKGEVVSMANILEEAKRSKLGVLVLTDDFFMNTPNPMRELEAFVDGEVKLLPLFFTMSVNEFKEKQRRDMWEEKWREWAAKDNTLVIDMWRSHLDVVSKFCGLEYCMTATNWADFIDIVVRKVIGIIGPATPFCANEVHGMARMCKVVNDMYVNCARKHSLSVDYTSTQVASTSANSGAGKDVGYKINVVAIHGFPGLGKTTLCRCLCDFFYGDFHGNVIYIELGSSGTTRRSRMEHVLFRLSRSQINDSHWISQLNNEEVENMFKKRLSSVKDPVFLAIDNILPDVESQEEADFYISCKLKKGSRVFITSRNEDILTNLTDQHSYRFSVKVRYMLKLELDEARDIFEQEFPDLREARLSNVPKEAKLERDVDAVLKMCTIHLERYHPLMLKSLAAFVRWDRLKPTLDWKGRLANLAEEGLVHKDDALGKVYKIFDMTYAPLTKEEQKVFLDWVLFERVLISKCPGSNNCLFQSDCLYGITSSYEWIQAVHSKPGKQRNLEKILSLLQELGFVEKIGSWIRIHDLFLDYGKHRADVESDQYVVVEDSNAWPDEDDVPMGARHVSISRCQEASSMVLDLRGVERMQVLHLVGNAGRQEVLLSRITCAHLLSLIVSVPAGAELRCSLDTEGWRSHCSKLKVLKLHGNVHFCGACPQDNSLMSPQMNPEPTFWGAFRNLESLHLVALPTSVQILDVTLCARLKKLIVQEMPGLKSIRGLENKSQLDYVEIRCLPHLQELALLNTTTADTEPFIAIEDCGSLERITLGCSWTRSSSWCAGAVITQSRKPLSIKVNCCPCLTNVDGLSQYNMIKLASFGNLDKNFKLGSTSHKFLTEMFEEMVKSAGIDSSLCKAAVVQLSVQSENDLTLGLAGVRELWLLEAQHIGLFITALFEAQPRTLQKLYITCQQGGDCGCDQNVPQFGSSSVDCMSTYYICGRTRLRYSCSKVRDLSSLANIAPLLSTLILRGCTAVEVWPDFSVMTGLQFLDLSNTSLKEWPIGVLHLDKLFDLQLAGCQQLPAKEIIFTVITHEFFKKHIIYSLFHSLRTDLRDGSRERSTVADVLEALSLEIVALFDRWSPWLMGLNDVISQRVSGILEIMYRVCFGEDGSCDFGQELHIAARMKGLLCSGGFLSLAYRAWICSNSHRAICVMVIALVGKARFLGACSNSAHALNDNAFIRLDCILRSFFSSCKYPYSFGFDDAEAALLGERVKAMVSMISTEAGKEIITGKFFLCPNICPQPPLFSLSSPTDP